MGFTLIEVVSMLILLGIISLLITNKSSSIYANEISDIQILKSSIRYTQSRALGDIVSWSFQVNGQTGIIKKNGATVLQVNFKTSSISNGNITFDNRGRPTDQNGVILSSPYSFTVVNYQQSAISVSPITGFIY